MSKAEFDTDQTGGIDAAINYVLPQVSFDLKTASPFQGFAPGTLTTSSFIQTIVSLPASILEFAGSRERIILVRCLGYNRYRIIPLESNFLGELPIAPDQPFWCFFSTEETIQDVRNCLEALQQPVLHFTSAETDDIPHFSTINRQTLLNYATDAIAYSLAQSPTRMAQYWSESLSDWHAEIAPEALGFPEWGHNATRPNNLTLRSLAFQFDEFQPLFGSDSSVYAKAILDGASAVRNIRESVLHDVDSRPLGLNDALGMIVTAPTVYRRLYRSADTWNVIDRQLGKKAGRFVRDFVARRTEFFSTANSEDVKTFEKSEGVHAALRIRQEELDTYTSAVTAIAASDFCPVIRLSPGIEQLQGLLRDIGGCARGNSPHQQWKLNKLVSRLTAGLITAIGTATMKELAHCSGTAKIVSDVPLEWLPIDGVPFCIRNATSRLPTTPGNMLFGESVMRRNIWIPRNQFSQILVVRSFEKSDPLRNVLVGALNSQVDKDTLDCEVHVRDVNTIEEFVSVLNKYDGPLLIFDGHGTSAGDDDIAGLVIGGEVVDCWKLRGIARIPPIVVLSACDTHPVDGSHASAANGFIAAGAQTVLGTLLPIEANLAANFIYRLVYRIGKFLKIATQHSGAIRWSEVIGGFQRMTYLTDLLRMLWQQQWITSAEIRDEIQLLGNTLINRRDPEWYEKIVNQLQRVGGIDAFTLDALVSEWFQLPESLLYVQVGNPETIIIKEHD